MSLLAEKNQHLHVTKSSRRRRPEVQTMSLKTNYSLEEGLAGVTSHCIVFGICFLNFYFWRIFVGWTIFKGTHDFFFHFRGVRLG